MKLLRCQKKHFYDGDMFASCPHCSGEISQNSHSALGVRSGGSTSTLPLSAQPLPVTEPLLEPVSLSPATPVVEPAPLANAVSESVPYHLPNEMVNTIGFYDFDGAEPVVGWLVCIKGIYHGQSFPLKSGQNLVGRDLKMNVSLSKDTSVSRNRHSIIIFDPKNAVFYIQQGENGLTYLNGELVLAPIQMKARAIVGIGAGEYIFVPLCDGSFSWDNYKQ